MSTSAPAPYPLTFEPAYQNYLWGGDRILKHFRRPARPGPIAESWEVSTRPELPSVVSSGPWKGRTLADLVEEHGGALVGTRAPGGRFPLLIKLLDARETLSVQVHPDDASAARHGGEAKTEMWYVLDADPGAHVFAGVRPGCDEGRFRAALREGMVPDLLRRHEVRRGDVIFIPGGRVHAIGAGCLILEVQQNSNTTYRLYDWDRNGPDGKPRDLHVEQAMKVIRWQEDGDGVFPAPSPARDGWSRILRSDYFLMESAQVGASREEATDGDSFQVLFVEAGDLTITWSGGEIGLPAGATAFVPAALGAYRMAGGAHGASAVIRIRLPEAG